VGRWGGVLWAHTYMNYVVDCVLVVYVYVWDGMLCVVMLYACWLQLLMRLVCVYVDPQLVAAAVEAFVGRGGCSGSLAGLCYIACCAVLVCCGQCWALRVTGSCSVMLG
jgi:hypothetical protein